MTKISAKLVALALVLMPLIGLVPKYVLIQHSLAGQRVEQTLFGFGDYTASLLQTGELRSCVRPPFHFCQPDRCLYATRMPAIPLLYAGLAKLVGTDSVAIDLAKCVLTAALLAGLLAVLVRDARPSLLGVILLYLLYFGPQALKHGAAIEYEEGLLLDLELSLAVALAYLLRPELALTHSRRIAMGLIAVAIAVLMYFIKTTALLMLSVVAGLFALRARAGWRLNLAAAVLIVVPFGAWALHTTSASGRVHLSSSWNGENLFRGYNSESAAIYPQILLDRIFDARRAVLDDGVTVPLGDYADRSQCFVDEWAWSKFYSTRARAWLADHPMEAFRFDLNKLWVALVEVRHTPYRNSATENDSEYPPYVAAAMLAWMIAARAALFFLIFRLVKDLFGRGRDTALWILALLAAGFAPYVIVFSYQRHVVPLLVMAGGLLVVRYGITARDAAPLHERHIGAR
jgi:hypothetical protein